MHEPERSKEEAGTSLWNGVRKHILIIYYVRLNSFLFGELFARLCTQRGDKINDMSVLKSRMISRLLSSG